MTPAAQYLRMSTDHQRYSLTNQAAVIGAFALKNDFEIVATFEDAGKSGLTLRERDGLKALINQSVSGEASFSTILVLDVSRWGRFQDPDQAAHYEFICREAGVNVIYVAEAFVNDGSTMASVVKHLKRVMAGEYSRELGEKIRVGKFRQAPLGFFVGGLLPYGVRTFLVDENGCPLTLQKIARNKNRRGDRAVFKWGPKTEIANIRRIFRWFVDDHMTLADIARQLNNKGVVARHGGHWRATTVKFVLKSEFAIGNFVYGKTTVRLKAPKSPNPPDEWIRTRVFAPIVTTRQFDAAQMRLSQRKGRNSCLKNEMLASLNRLYEEKGKLTNAMVRQCPYTPGVNSYRSHFGSMTHAMQLVGFQRTVGRFTKGQMSVPESPELLDMLKALHDRLGYLSVAAINAEKTIPHASVYRARFGSVMGAYAAAGFPTTLRDAIHAGNSRKSRLHASEPLQS